MNILHIIPNLRKGGAERICLDIANELQARPEHEYLLILLDEENEYTFLSKGINHIVTSSKLHLKIVGKSKNDLNDLQSIADKFKPDVIHSHLFLAELVSKHIQSDAVRFCHVHDNMSQLEKVSLLKINSKSYIVKYFERSYYSRLSSKYLTNFLCISEDAKSFIEQNLNDCPNKIIKFPNAINTEVFSQKNKPDDDIIRLVNIGSFVPKKAQSLLIETIAELKRIETRPIKLHLLGNGPLKHDCEVLAKELGVQNEIKFHGNVNDPEKYLKEASLYIHSANYEPFGLVLIEAMSTGTPVIATDGKGNRDFMDGTNGILLKDRNPVNFAQTISRILNDKTLYSDLQKGAIETSKQYDIVPYVDRLVDTYKTALNER